MKTETKFNSEVWIEALGQIDTITCRDYVEGFEARDTEMERVRELAEQRRPKGLSNEQWRLVRDSFVLGVCHTIVHDYNPRFPVYSVEVFARSSTVLALERKGFVQITDWIRSGRPTQQMRDLFAGIKPRKVVW